ncbi:MAG: glycosyltransferase family 2 protein [Ignisphaera sp.]
MLIIGVVMQQVSIVLPTFKEKENINILFNEIRNKINLRGYEVLVVDDNSPDKTWAEALNNIGEYDVVVKRINMKGLSSAVIDGVLFSLGGYVVVMDADLQHPPEVVNNMFEKIKNDCYEIIVGSRYMHGGGVIGWSKIRLLTSKGATLIAKILLPYARKISDPMSGFFMVKKELIEKNKDKLDPMGFKILLEILEKCRPNKVAEVPYVFRSRYYGKSKLGTKTIIDFIIHVLKLSGWRPLKFSAVGLTGVLVNLFMLWFIGAIYPLLVRSFFALGSAIAIEVSILWNFIVHEVWTFRDRRADSLVKRLTIFHIATSPGALAQYISAISVRYGLSFNPFIAQLVGIIVGFPVNYIVSELGVWKTYRASET